MNALVRIALKARHTFIVMSIFVLIAGGLAILRTPIDIFPEIRIPIISVVWQYTGLPPDEMSGRIVTPYQRVLTTTVNDIQRIDANSYNGIGIVKIYFQPGADIRTANAQVTAISQTILRQFPTGTTPPLILNYNASTVPIIQLALSGEGLTEQNLSDLGLNNIRSRLITVPGAGVPYPYGGKTRQIQIDLDPQALHARGLSGQDVANALAAQNLINPIGTQKIDRFEYTLQLNNAPSEIKALGDLPIKSVNGAVVYIRDVAQVRDGNPPQTNIVQVNGARSGLLSVLKNGAVSTLSIIDGIKARLAEIKPSLPDALKIDLLADQSVFVRGAVTNVVHEGVLAAVLTSIMILLFLGSWRSTVIIAISIPLAVLASIATLSALGETLNIMTLGGLALAVGILVDEATVTIENINAHLERGQDVRTAIIDASDEIATPAFVSMLCVCIVFIPMFFLEGIAKFLFVPMAEAVMFAMAFSFLLSRTLVPTLAIYMLRPHEVEEPGAKRGFFSSIHHRFNAGFDAFRDGYAVLLASLLMKPRTFCLLFMLIGGTSFLLTPYLGRIFFPRVDGGQILIHVRADVGTRVEETARQLAKVEEEIRTLIPAEEIQAIVNNIGIPISGINMSYNNTGVIGPQDGDVQIALAEGHKPTPEYVNMLRDELPRRFPSMTFSFLPADIVSQILNFGAPSPIDIQIKGGKLADNFDFASKVVRAINQIPGIADVRIQQSASYPAFKIDVDRSRAQTVGISERDVANSLGVSMAGTSQVAPAFWLNPVNGVQYPIAIQTPQYRTNSLPSLKNLPINTAGTDNNQVLGALATVERTKLNALISQTDIQSLVQVFATFDGRSLGDVAGDVETELQKLRAELPKGSTVTLAGQARTMDAAYTSLMWGLLGAIVLIYLLIVINFQSWSDPLVIIMALPAALAGIVWILFLTNTPLSVPALTGAIMCMGVATANSVLVVTFARQRLAQGESPLQAALDAGFYRMRPVIMTALAMIIGMAPMALGLGEGGEQNAPLGRAVIGGLLFATVATLIFVPVVFAIVHRERKPRDTATPTTEAQPHGA